MPHIVTEKCIKCKYTDCVEVCPVECFFDAGDCLVINPDTCIDCGVCVPECPIGAIVDDGTHIDGKTVESILSCKDASLLTKDQSNLLKMANFNKERSHKCPTAIAGEPMKNADEWAEREDKINFIQSDEVKN